LTNLTNDPMGEYDAAWSPDGTQLAFDRTAKNDSDIWVMNADGTAQTDLTNTTTTAEFDPAWSPDGTKVAFTRRTGANYDIWTMNADGTGQVQVTTSPTTEESSPIWSPGGQFILFVTNRDRQYEIYGVRPGSGLDPTDLTNSSPGSDLDPSWEALPGPPPNSQEHQQLAGGHVPPALQGNACPDTAGKNLVVGTPGNDPNLRGTPGADLICGLGGNDVIYGLGGNDVIYGGPGTDTIHAGAGADNIHAKDGRKDLADGGPGTDQGSSDPVLDDVRQVEVDPNR
jgi:RTX calcium-binding nonapeptide repeat (4 copies)/WD40-like Beta Propeller Repeat